MSFKAFLHAAGLCSLLALPALAAVLHEQLAAVPAGWQSIHTPADSSTIVLQIGLQQRNLDKLHSLIYAVSTPGNADYGNHMDRDDVAALLQPSREANTAVLNWLEQAGVTNVHSDGHWVNFATTVGTANQLLNTQFRYYENGGVRKLRTTRYSVPEVLTKHIDLITPTTYFGRIGVAKSMRQHKKSIAARQVGANCTDVITPECIKKLYKINYTPDVKSGSRIGFGSFLNQSASISDLYLFEADNAIPRQGFSVELINGGVDDQTTTSIRAEANLDVQYIIGVSHPLPVTEYITAGSPPIIPNLEVTPEHNTNEPYLPYYQYLLSKPNSQLPQVISNSYGDDEQSVPIKYAHRVCNMIGQLGLRGISVLESSGDTGVGAPCQSNDGKETPQFTPIFPATCPFITAVGGTQSIYPEIAWDGSSGGFSNYFSRPSYQHFAVSTYFYSHINQKTLQYCRPFFNESGRGFPDIAAHSFDPYFSTFGYDNPQLSAGTSAAVPVVASIIALLNDARLCAGKKSLGFANPFLYSVSFSDFKAIVDIRKGGSVGCTGISTQTGSEVLGGSVIPYASWNATTGWDPVTGLGVPNFERLLQQALRVGNSSRPH